MPLILTLTFLALLVLVVGSGTSDTRRKQEPGAVRLVLRGLFLSSIVLVTGFALFAVVFGMVMDARYPNP